MSCNREYFFTNIRLKKHFWQDYRGFANDFYSERPCISHDIDHAVILLWRKNENVYHNLPITWLMGLKYLNKGPVPKPKNRCIAVEDVNSFKLFISWAVLLPDYPPSIHCQDLLLFAILSFQGMNLLIHMVFTNISNLFNDFLEGSPSYQQIKLNGGDVALC